MKESLRILFENGIIMKIFCKISAKKKCGTSFDYLQLSITVIYQL